MLGFKEEIRHEYPLNESSIVFDIGGYKGEWADIIYKKYGCQIYCFEPVFKIKRTNYLVYDFGLGGSTRKEYFRESADATGIASIVTANRQVDIVDIMELISKYDLKKIDLMKINIEGMEYELLNRLIEADWIKNITDIQVQFHRLVTSDEQMYLIQKELKKTHYPTYQYRYVWENWRLK